MGCSSPAGNARKFESGLEFGAKRRKIELKANPMIELKVYCDCGQKYKFDVEPVNGRMPFTVACPICKRDGTAKANEMLQQMSVFKPIGAEPSAPPTSITIAPPPVPIHATAPTPVAPASISAPPPPPSAAAPRLRINASTPAEAHQAPAPGAPPPIAPAILSPTSGRPRIGAAAATEEGPAKKPSFAMGLLGAFVGALVGAIIYFSLYKVIGPWIVVGRYFLALGLGALAGFLANYLGKGEGSKELGGLAAVFTVVGILGAQYLISVDRWHKAFNISNEVTQAIADGGYTESVKLAKEAVNAIPNGTDGEIRIYLAKQQAEEGQPPKPEAIGADEVKQFREMEWTNYQDLASGKLTKEQFWTKNGFDPKAAQKAADETDDTVKGLFILATFTRGGIISMIAAAGLAFKMSANA